MKLAGKIAIVTGASKGLGANMAEALAAEGASVVVNYASSAAAAEAVVARITAAGGKAVAVKADVSDPSTHGALFEAFGGVNILVNNAGIYEVANLEDIDEASFHRHFNLNVLAPLLLIKAAAARMGAGDSIINVSSVVSTLSPAGTTVYNATKSALDGITRSLAKELGPRGIRVNSINPGLVETEGLHASPLLGAREGLASITPLGRIGQPGDIGPGVVFLASGDAGWMTGESLYIAGGLH